MNTNVGIKGEDEMIFAPFLVLKIKFSVWCSPLVQNVKREIHREFYYTVDTGESKLKLKF